LVGHLVACKACLAESGLPKDIVELVGCDVESLLGQVEV